MSSLEGSRRIQRVEREVREVLAQYLIRNLRGQLQGLTTIAKVKLSGDLKLASVYVSIMGTPAEAKQNLELLAAETKEMQREIGRTLNLKFCPKLRIFQDDTYEQSMRVQNVLKTLTGPTDPSSEAAIFEAGEGLRMPKRPKNQKSKSDDPFDSPKNSLRAKTGGPHEGRRSSENDNDSEERSSFEEED